MKLADTVILWTPACVADNPLAGTVQVLPWPWRGVIDNETAASALGHEAAFGGCWPPVCTLPNHAARQNFLLSLAIGLIVRDGLAPALVHQELLAIDEYRAAVPGDIRKFDSAGEVLQ